MATKLSKNKMRSVDVPLIIVSMVFIFCLMIYLAADP